MHDVDQLFEDQKMVVIPAHTRPDQDHVTGCFLWQKDSLSAGKIAAYSGNNIPATSRILDRMIEKKLVRRENDTEDRRSVRVALCDAGRALDHLKDFHNRVNATLLDKVSQAEVDLLFSLLERVEAKARGWTPS